MPFPSSVGVGGGKEGGLLVVGNLHKQSNNSLKIGRGNFAGLEEKREREREDKRKKEAKTEESANL